MSREIRLRLAYLHDATASTRFSSCLAACWHHRQYRGGLTTQPLWHKCVAHGVHYHNDFLKKRAGLQDKAAFCLKRLCGPASDPWVSIVTCNVHYSVKRLLIFLFFFWAQHAGSKKGCSLLLVQLSSPVVSILCNSQATHQPWWNTVLHEQHRANIPALSSLNLG